ncbi:transporter substrate-binding domain-containing protein [Marinobacter alexandrii]|uniref:substrate-binding periplasmic protein n=1 Tax=Marinobacter alexandrii TaxID=2570351 RepID=UPI002ABDE26E|nr:transporter substrate-binding domain-containing protein [Marinobacter alexandrii]
MPILHRLNLTLAVVITTFLLGGTSVVQAKTVITVGAYHFPPVAEVSDDHQPHGLLADLVQGLEATHNDIDIQIFHTSPKRRHLDFDAGLYDVIFFESSNWGWAHREITFSRPILTDEDLYVALRKPGRDLDFFNDIGNRQLVVISGYYYGFADLENNTKNLQKNYSIEFSDSQNRALKLIKADRPSVAEVAIISRAYLQQHLSEQPEDWRQLLISDRLDQRYELRIIARRNGPVSASDMMQRLAPLVADGSYRMMVEKWGLQLPPGFLTNFKRR